MLYLKVDKKYLQHRNTGQAKTKAAWNKEKS